MRQKYFGKFGGRWCTLWGHTGTGPYSVRHYNWSANSANTSRSKAKNVITVIGKFGRFIRRCIETFRFIFYELWNACRSSFRRRSHISYILWCVDKAIRQEESDFAFFYFPVMKSWVGYQVPGPGPGSLKKIEYCHEKDWKRSREDLCIFLLHSIVIFYKYPSSCYSCWALKGCRVWWLIWCRKTATTTLSRDVFPMRSLPATSSTIMDKRSLRTWK